MARKLTLDTLPDFRAWLEARRPLGVAVSRRQLAFADATQAWTVRLDDEVARRAVTAVGLSGRKGWAAPAAATAARIAQQVGVPLGDLVWLHDLETVRRAITPGVAPVELPAAAGAAALRVAREAARVAGETPASLRAVGLRSAAVERLWWPAQARGWRVDVEALEAERARLEAERVRHARRLGIDLTATATDAGAAAAHAWLMERGVVLRDRDGEPSLSRDDFARVQLDGSDVAAVTWADFREARALLRRLAKARELSRALRGERVFSTLHLHGAVTGRTTSTGPALQNLTAEHRGLFLAEPGMVLVGLDLDRVEPRVAAALSGDPLLRADVESGDVYSALAREVFGEAAVAAFPGLRAQAKEALLGLFYGRGVASLAAGLGISVDEARALRERIWARYGVLRAWADELERDARAGVQRLTPYGRPVPVPGEGRSYAAVNHMVQATAADLLFTGTARVAEQLGAEALWLSVHDELIVQVSHERVAEAQAALAEGMSARLNGVAIAGTPAVLGQAWRKA